MSHTLLKASPFLLLALLSSCFEGGSTNSSGSNSIGSFEVETVNVVSGDTWELNRRILISFNHPVDPDSIDLTTVIIRPVSNTVSGSPVTGSFELVSGTEDKTLAFLPTCPTNSENNNGAFVPGGHIYELTLPTNSTFGGSTLRDTAGHSLSVGLTVRFQSPTPPTDNLFIDTIQGPALLESVILPEGLNLFSDSDPTIAIHFNQPIDASPDNLNTDRVTLRYSDGEIGAVGEDTFSPNNRLPGELLLYQNCTSVGSTVFFQVAGLLPPNRNIQATISPAFQDIAGEFNSQAQTSALLPTPSLTSYYENGPAFNEAGGNVETVDEFRDFFLDSTWISADAASGLPAADWSLGSVTASFEYPGNQVATDEDFFLDEYQDVFLDTDGTLESPFLFNDSTGHPFSMVGGVLHVDDFTISEGARVRGLGSNPLIIYATGTVKILGTLDVSGENASAPLAITTPGIPEFGALGQCGGGDGGTASAQTGSETLRAASGEGAFGIGNGGGGGEGSLNWESTDMGSYVVPEEGKIAGGGAGGNFALTTPSAVTWERWPITLNNPENYDDAGPDIRFDRHTVFDDGFGGYDMTEVAAFFIGAEDGMRGNSWHKGQATEPPGVTAINTLWGGYGMEDASQDMDANDESGGGDGLDPAWTSNPPSSSIVGPPFNYGHPTNGPDGGFINPSVLGSTSTTDDDFWGIRYNGFTGGTSTVGELTTPWAGSGGGGGGDSSLINRVDADADSFLDPLGDFFPDNAFPNGWTKAYYKGAAGGGGGGQLQILAIGAIVLGGNSLIKANGGIGNSGESLWGLNQQVSGSGGGSGGHIVLHSATGLNLSDVDFTADPFNVLPGSKPELIQAIGGRRGWVMSDSSTLPAGPDDGNSDFMIGRGGAGSNGIIQIHIPEPGVDIDWPDPHDANIDNYIRGGVALGPVDTDLLEEMLDLIAEPSPYALVPMFASKSQLQSEWIDSGLASLHMDPNSNLGTFPDFANALLVSFSGTDGSGDVQSTGESFDLGDAVVTTANASGASTSGYSIRFVDPATNVAGFSADLLRNPNLLVGYEFLPDQSDLSTHFRITDASWSGLNLNLTTSVLDGPLPAISALGWAIHERFLGIRTGTTKDRLPVTSDLTFLFEGSDDMVTTTGWSPDIANLTGSRYFRYQVVFDIDSNQSGVAISSEKPSLEYVKIPFAW